jgi:ABC-type cobalamin/Fe3+-siderophores transport system ATPase subunit
VITSHDPRAALAEADQVLALKDGRVAHYGDPAAVTDDALRSLYATG